MSFSVDMSKSTFKTRSAVLNRLSQIYDLDQTKPFQKEVQLVTNNTDNEQLLSLDVSCFDYWNCTHYHITRSE